MRKVLVTGAGGFIGYHLSNDLTDHGYDVTGVDLHYPGEHTGRRFNAVTGDFRDQDLIKGLLDSVDVVVHLASAHLQISLTESEYWDINVYGLRKFLELARARGVRRFIHVSSVGAYGNLKKWPADEKTECKPQSIYGETKVAGEREVLKFSRETSFPVVIIRPAWVYGPGCPRTQKLARALRKGRFIMIGKCENMRHPLYIQDMLDAFRVVMEKESAIGELFVIGGERAITTSELIDALCSVMQISKPGIKIPYSVGLMIATVAEAVFGLLRKEPPISRRTLEFFDTNNAFDISKAENVLGFKPRFSFEDGLRHCSDWLMKA
jgi:nucleoside-diphosphate-sugar epimerase